MVRSFYTNNKTKSFKRNPTYIFSIEERHFGAENWQMFGSMLQCIEMIYFDLHRQLQLTQRKIQFWTLNLQTIRSSDK